MRKPLELTVYPKDPTYEPSDSFTVYLMGDGGKECAGTSCALPSRKHFTDAELAADYYREAWCHETSISDNDGYDGTAETRKHRNRATTLWRFADLPHYDEVA